MHIFIILIVKLFLYMSLHLGLHSVRKYASDQFLADIFKMIRRKKIMVCFGSTCKKNLGSVGRKIILFYEIILPRLCKKKREKNIEKHF